MRILHCLETIGSGGVEQLRLALVRTLPRDQFEHRFICTKSRGPISDELRGFGVRIIETGAVRSVLRPERYRLAFQEIRRWRPHVVHGAVIEGYTLAGIAGRLGRVPVVIMEETSDPRNRRWKGHLLARAMAGFADRCVGESPAVGRYLVETLGVPERKVRVINNGVERPVPPSSQEVIDLRERYGLLEADVVIGSVGRLSDDHKRFSDLIAALVYLRDLPHVKLLVVGDGPDRARLEERAVRDGVAGRVVFAGYQPVVGHFYALMDVFALASSREAFGLVIAEAMRCGLPVVATRVGGIPDVVDHGQTGLLVPPRQPRVLAEALRRLVKNEELRTRFGRAGLELAEREFSSERYVSDVRALYEEVLSEYRRL